MDLQQKAREALLGILQSIHMDEEARQEAILSITWRQATRGEVPSDAPVFLIGHPEQTLPDLRKYRGWEDRVKIVYEYGEKLVDDDYRRTVQ